ncbi:glucans biosynthesis glucosyltransferase MdoH [Pseudovibrio flavus]|uniref:glucans biosynthesis glucosyltransferase MdoH n=1 Tax=Pseudovibrio flavus TaxID=2529854 RepID=UPI00211C9DA9|nr:glucans biosynthesis glucosyltransferase MdoH [Pseudovibrio flavus]
MAASLSSNGALFWWRAFALGLPVLVAALTSYLWLSALATDGLSFLDWLRTALLFLGVLWLGWGASVALIGVAVSGAGRRAHPETDHSQVLTLPRHDRCALVIPVYNEDADAVYARLDVMRQQLAKLAVSSRIDFHVLSDSTRDDVAEKERRLAEHLLAETPDGPAIYYRRRAQNTAGKAGNVAEFLERSGGAYETMIVLDADSLMSGDTIKHMIEVMDREPQLGLLQTLPIIHGAPSVLGVVLQFSSAAYSRVFARGLAKLQGATGPFWGHNAIIRTRAFAECCGLPSLEGPAPFGGHILSHDTVEAALLARGGWEVRLEPELEGSYEEAPANLLGYAARDRRWCQGNIQHLRLVAAKGLSPWSRLSFLLGAYAYLAAPLWLGFIALSAFDLLRAEVGVMEAGNANEASYAQALQVNNTLLIIGVFVLLFGPRLLIALRRWRELTGNISAFALAFSGELAFMFFAAPCLMAFQARAIFEIALGRDCGWTIQHRDGGGLRFSDCLSACWWICIPAVFALVAIIWIGGAQAALWLLPVFGVFALSPFVVMISSKKLSDPVRQKTLQAFASEEENSLYASFNDAKSRLALQLQVPEGASQTANIKPAKLNG